MLNRIKFAVIMIFLTSVSFNTEAALIDIEFKSLVETGAGFGFEDGQEVTFISVLDTNAFVDSVVGTSFGVYHGDSKFFDFGLESAVISSDRRISFNVDNREDISGFSIMHVDTLSSESGTYNGEQVTKETFTMLSISALEYAIDENMTFGISTSLLQNIELNSLQLKTFDIGVSLFSGIRYISNSTEQIVFSSTTDYVSFDSRNRLTSFSYQIRDSGKPKSDVPEPSAFIVLLLGLLGLCLRRSIYK